jgi:hypothetical protein
VGPEKVRKYLLQRGKWVGFIGIQSLLGLVGAHLHAGPEGHGRIRLWNEEDERSMVSTSENRHHLRLGGSGEVVEFWIGPVSDLATAWAGQSRGRREYEDGVAEAIEQTIPASGKHICREACSLRQHGLVSF